MFSWVMLVILRIDISELFLIMVIKLLLSGGRMVLSVCGKMISWKWS